MAVNRQEVKKSRLLRHLVRNGMDKRQMVRELSKCDHISLSMPDIACAMVWEHTHPKAISIGGESKPK